MKVPYFAVAFLLSLSLSFGQKSDYLFEHLTIDQGLPNNTVISFERDHLGFTWIATNDGLARYDGYDFRIYEYDRDNPASLSNNKIYCVFEDSKQNLWIGTSMGLNLYDRDLDNFIRFYHDPDNDFSLSANNIRTIYEDKSGNLWVGTIGGGLNRYDYDADRFYRYNFPDRNVSAVLDDADGKLWIGTGSPAITQLDWRNNEFITFPFPENPDKGLKPQTLKSFYKDNRGNFWVCTEGAGLFLFDRDAKEFTQHFYRDGQKGLNNNIVSDIFQYDEHTLWIATDGGGINVFDLDNQTFRYVRNNIADAKSLSSNALYSFFRDNDGVIWIGTFGGGVNILNPHRQEFRFYTQRAADPTSLSHKSVLCFYEDSGGIIWVGTDGGGLNLFDPEKGIFERFMHDPDDPNSISSNVVTSITEGSDGHLWVGTFAGGLNRFDRNTRRFFRYTFSPSVEGSIASNNVWKLLEDDRQNLWVGTLDGLEKFCLKDRTFKQVPAQRDPDEINYPKRIISLFKSADGNIWVGSTGVWLLDRETMEFSLIEGEAARNIRLKDYDIRDFHEDEQGIMWIASEGGGLIRYDRESGDMVSFTTTDGLPSDAIHQIIEDEEGILWLSTNRGISRFDPVNKTFNNYNVHDGLQSNQFAYSASLYSTDGKVYFGGVNGFNVFHPERIKENLTPPKVYITEFSLSNQPVEIGEEGSPLNKHIMKTREITLPYQSVFSFRFTAINYISTSKNSYKYKLEGFDDWNDVGNQRTATYTNIGPGRYVFRVIASNNDGVWNEEGASVVINIMPPFYRTWIAYVIYVILFFVILYFAMNYIVNRQKYKHDLMIKDLEKAKIEEINQIKLRFFTNIAHEFRTPLTLILGPLDKIMSSQGSIDASLRKQLNIMGRNAGRLLRLVNELMEFRKIEMGKLKLKIVKADLAVFLNDVKSVFDEHARMHDIDFTFESNKPEVMAWFDKEKMEKIVYNILSNSFKFTPDCGRISVELDLAQRPLAGTWNGDTVEHVQIKIHDNGIGIPEKELPKIFDRFYQVKNKNSSIRTIGISGTGIGLALAKELIEFHKGDILVSGSPGGGSVFTIVFPADKKYFDQEIVVEQPSSDDYVYQYAPGLFGIPHAELKQHPLPAKTEESADKPVLLFVDDNQDMRSYMRSSLENSYVVHEAVNGLEGLEKAQKLMPDMIVSDVMMPELDGLEMCKRLKNDMSTSHLPIILLTAKASDDFTIEGFDAGADEYIPKPFNPNLLHSRIKNILEIRHHLKERFRKEGILEPSEVSVTSADEVFLKNAMDVVERNIGNPEFRVCNFVSEMNMSRSVLYRKFEALTGQSVNEFVRNTRLKRAAQLLSLNELTVSEVTYEVGFNDPQYFSKCFSKQFGMTPSEYARRNHKKTVDSR